MYNTRTVADAKQQNAQYNKEYKIRVRSEIDNHGAREERLTREAAYSKRYREKNKEDQFNSLEEIHITHEQSTLTQQPSTNDAAQLQRS
jgi:hypothetical protein